MLKTTRQENHRGNNVEIVECSMDATAQRMEKRFNCGRNHFVEEKVVVIHRGRCNNKVCYRLSHDVVT